MKPFRTGTAAIAFRMGVPIVPTHIQGSFEALSRYAKWPRFVPVTIRIGAPIPVAQKNDPTPEEIDALTATMRDAVVALETENRAAGVRSGLASIQEE
jgi:1-acyl-sn-glycerol-3-phosphate acyltransferase